MGQKIALKSLLSNRNVARYGIRRISAIQRPRAIFFPWELVSIGIRLNSQYEPCFVMLEQRKMGKRKKNSLRDFQFKFVSVILPIYRVRWHSTQARILGKW